MGDVGVAISRGCDVRYGFLVHCTLKMLTRMSTIKCTVLSFFPHL